jgi:general stress protein 26
MNTCLNSSISASKEVLAGHWKHYLFFSLYPNLQEMTKSFYIDKNANFKTLKDQVAAVVTSLKSTQNVCVLLNQNNSNTTANGESGAQAR